MGNDYTRQFSPIFIRLAKQYNATLIPFLLEGVASIPSLNLADGKHPNVEGQKIVRDNVWEVLEGVMWIEKNRMEFNFLCLNNYVGNKMKWVKGLC